MAQANPWLRSVRDRDDPAVDWRMWLPTEGVSSDEVLLGAPTSAAGLPASTGPLTPQPHVKMPEDALPVRLVQDSGSLWLVGAHGGAGESTLAGLDEGWRASGHAWPSLPSGDAAPCVVVARTHVRGLLATRAALTQWAASGTGESARLLGLVLVADAPGRLPAPLRDLAKVVAGGAPRTWEVPWVEAWRMGDDVNDRLPRAVSELVDQLRHLATATARQPFQH